jgi:dihydrofolate reductase
MARLLYSVSMSLDGFIAGPGGDMSWLAPFIGPDPTADRLMAETGSLLVGSRTHGGDDPHKGAEGEGEAFGGGWSGEEFVVTHHPDRPTRPGLTFVPDFATGIRLAKAAAGEKYVNVLGASIARQCLELGELDEILTFICPVLLGDGTRLFDSPGGKQVNLERIDLTHTDLSTNIWYSVIR